MILYQLFNESPQRVTIPGLAYWKSSGVTAPNETFNPGNAYLQVFVDWDTQSDFGTIPAGTQLDVVMLSANILPNLSPDENIKTRPVRRF